MNFYEDISKARNIQLDKIYRSRSEMDEALASGEDDIFVGHFVLVKYDTSYPGVEEQSIYRGYLDLENFSLPPEEGINYNLYFNSDLSSQYQCKTFTKVYSQPSLNDGSYYYLSKTNYQKWPKDKNFNNNIKYYQIYEEATQEQIDDTAIVKYRKVKVVDTTQGETPIEYTAYVSEDIVGSNNFSPLDEKEYVVLNSESTLYLHEGAFARLCEDSSFTDYYFECIGADENGNAIWKYISIENSIGTSDENYKYKYFQNYKKDKERYFLEPDFRGYDATIWQKVYSSGQGKYVLICSLNAPGISFTLVSDPPSTDPKSAYIGTGSSDNFYILHMPTNYGFRIKEFNDDGNDTVPRSDQAVKIALDDENSEEIDGSIYFNNGNHLNNHLYDGQTENKIIFTPGVSNKKDYYDANGDKLENVKDTLELSISLPVIGNVVSNGYDLIYGYDDNGVRHLNNEYLYADDENFIEKDSIKNKDLNTLVGTLNQSHEFLGQIIYRLDNQHVYTEEEIKELKDNFIYLYQGKYYKKGYTYNIEPIDENYYQFIPIPSGKNNLLYDLSDYFIEENDAYIQYYPGSTSGTKYLRKLVKYIFEEVSLVPFDEEQKYYTFSGANFEEHLVLDPFNDYGQQYYVANIKNTLDILEDSELTNIRDYSSVFVRIVKNSNGIVDYDYKSFNPEEDVFDSSLTYFTSPTLYSEGAQPENSTKVYIIDNITQSGRTVRTYTLQEPSNYNSSNVRYVSNDLCIEQNEGHSVLIFPEVEESTIIYQPNYYYYYANNKYILIKVDSFQDFNKNLSEDEKIYSIDFIPSQQLYIPRKFYVQDVNGPLVGLDGNQYALSLDEYDSNKTYFIRKKFVVINDNSGRFPPGYEWAPMAEMVPASVTLGIAVPKTALVELNGIMDGDSSFLGTILRANKLLGTNDKLERNVQTLTGVINKGRDLLGQWDTLQAGKVLGLNNFGQIYSTDTSIEGLKQAFQLLSGDEDTATNLENLANALNWSNNLIRGRLKVLTQEQVAPDNHLAPIIADKDGGHIDFNYYYGRLIYLLLNDQFDILKFIIQNGKNLWVKLITFLNLITIDSLDGKPTDSEKKYNDMIDITVED